MKVALILLLVVVPCISVFSLGWGLATDLYVANPVYTQGSVMGTAFMGSVSPALVIMTGSRWEIRPFLFLGWHDEADGHGFYGGAYLADFHQWSVGLGAGLFYHFVQTDGMDISVGPKLSGTYYLTPTGSSAPAYASYYRISAGLSVPVNFDLKVTSKFLLRAAIEIPGMHFDQEAGTVGGVEIVNRMTTLADFETGFTPYFGFTFMF